MSLSAKKKFNSRYFTLLLQLIVMAVLFVFVFDKQAVFLLKDSLSRLQLGSGAERLIFEVLCGFKMLLHAPSFMGTIFIVLPFICLITTINIIKTIFISYKIKINESIELKKINVEKYCKAKNFSYLENMRLLF